MFRVEWSVAPFSREWGNFTPQPDGLSESALVFHILHLGQGVSWSQTGANCTSLLLLASDQILRSSRTPVFKILAISKYNMTAHQSKSKMARECTEDCGTCWTWAPQKAALGTVKTPGLQAEGNTTLFLRAIGTEQVFLPGQWSPACCYHSDHNTCLL